MNIKDFKSGTLRQEYQYKSFIPEMINHTFTWDDPQINTMLEDATRALGELNAFTMIVPNVDILEFKLLLLSRDLITFNDFDFEEKINKFIEPYLDGKSFSSALSQVNNLLEYLVTKKEIGQLKEIQEKVFQIINQHESFKLW